MCTHASLDISCDVLDSPVAGNGPSVGVKQGESGVGKLAMGKNNSEQRKLTSPICDGMSVEDTAAVTSILSS